jgi:voltage-gated potassium channel Kch
MTPSEPLTSSQPRHQKSRPFYLMIALFLLLLLSPVFEGRAFATLVLSALFTLILISSAMGVMNQRRFLVPMACLGVPWVVMSWLEALVGLNVPADVCRLSLQAAFALLLVILWGLNIFRSTRVTTNTLCRAVSAYILIGVTWAGLYGIVSHVNHGAFGPGSGSALTWNEGIYFSFVTLTTLGYGDITPVSSLARSLAMVEAVIGPMYLAILVARLVALYKGESQEAKQR